MPQLWNYNFRTNKYQYMAMLTESPPIPTKFRSWSDDVRFLQHIPPAIEYDGDIAQLTDVHRYIPDFVGTVSSLGLYRDLTDIPDFIKTHPSVMFGTTMVLSLAFVPNGAFATFGIHVPPLRFIAPAYLSQTSLEDEDSWEDLVLVNNILFELRGEFTADPCTFSPPVYLFHRALGWEIVNGVRQVDISYLSKPFYWYLDPDGRSCLPEEWLEDYGIPKVNVMLWIGRCWEKPHYAAVREYLLLENQDPIQFAKDHGYPILQKWEEDRFKTVNDGQSNEVGSDNEDDEYHSCEE
ncbi:hypothetical protein V5O48_013965 [Marasmius crinis-equi]|uniref:Uncharacterized protein n=1 Tax=Marasmius crinis-equi TaxID=585013 RepID=A0ABR3EYM0_9AGAR